MQRRLVIVQSRSDSYQGTRFTSLPLNAQNATVSRCAAQASKRISRVLLMLSNFLRHSRNLTIKQMNLGNQE
jgi:hypothetical protein